MPLTKRQPPVVTEVNRDDYSIRFVIRHRKSRTRLQPERYAEILDYSATLLETWAAQMRDEARQITEP